MIGEVYQSIPKTAHPLPRHLTGVLLHTVGNLTQNEACIHSCDNLSTFKSLLKTYLFRKAYYC